MKFRMLSLLSIILVLTIKSLEISAKDYHELRVLARAIPPSPYVPSIVPFEDFSELDSVVLQLAEANAIKEMYVGLNDSITQEYTAYEKLKSIATEEELNELLLHESPVVKVYAYRALVVNEMNMNCDVELALLEDTTCVDWYSDELVTNTTVKDMIQLSYFE